MHSVAQESSMFKRHDFTDGHLCAIFKNKILGKSINQYETDIEFMKMFGKRFWKTNIKKKKKG